MLILAIVLTAGTVIGALAIVAAHNDWDVVCDVCMWLLALLVVGLSVIALVLLWARVLA